MKKERFDWSEVRKYLGLPTGAGFQAAEHHPEKTEDLTGIDVPDSLFEEVMDPLQADKAMHFVFSYSAAWTVLEGIEASPYSFDLAEKALTVNAATLLGGSIKEFTDPVYDPFDMAANLAGANTALLHHYGDRKDAVESHVEEAYRETVDLEPREVYSLEKHLSRYEDGQSSRAEFYRKLEDSR